MSYVLYGAGALAVMAGVAMAVFGVPVSEFSFGNTLIISGTISVVGGLIVIGLAAAVGHLRRISDALAARVSSRPPRALDLFEPGAVRQAAAAGRVPFPPKPKDAGLREPAAAVVPPPVASMRDRPLETFAPTLPNPDEPPVTVAEEVSLSPQQPASGPAPAANFEEPEAPEPPRAFTFERPERREEPAPETGWQAPPEPPAESPQRTTFFDTMWPAEPKATKAAPAREEPAEPPSERAPQAAAQEPAEPPEEAPRVDAEPRAVAILKSGVVDGMGYTLYVDGSIEAELPNGTLRFASINELRSHLEKTA